MNDAASSRDAGRTRAPGRRKTSLSIQAALMLSVALSLVPAFGIIIWTGLEHGDHLTRSAREQSLRQVDSFAEIQSRVTYSARQMLQTLASLPSFRTMNAGQMTPLLLSVHEHDQEYLNLAVVDLKGIVVASSRLKPGVDLSSRSLVSKIN